MEGRSKDQINRGGEKISAEEIENVAYGIAAVEFCAAVAVPDAELGERVGLCVVLRPGMTLTLDDVRAHYDASDVARYKYPERLELYDSLPIIQRRKSRQGPAASRHARTLTTTRVFVDRDPPPRTTPPGRRRVPGHAARDAGASRRSCRPSTSFNRRTRTRSAIHQSKTDHDSKLVDATHQPRMVTAPVGPRGHLWRARQTHWRDVDESWNVGTSGGYGLIVEPPL